MPRPRGHERPNNDGFLRPRHTPDSPTPADKIVRGEVKARAVQSPDESKSAKKGSKKSAAKAFNLLPFYEKTFADHLNPILAYRCITKEDSREAPSFLFESVE